MARFLKAPQQQMVDMTSQPMAPFYISLMEKHQQNLDKATGMKMEYIDKINQIPIYTDEDRKATVGLAEERLSEALNEEFVSPTRLANTLMQVNKEISPGIQALKAKAQAVNLQQDLKNKWGLDWWGDDVSKQSITDPTGKFVDIANIKGINYNKEQLRSLFERDNAAKFLQEIEGKQHILGNGYLTRITERGLSDEKKLQYAPGTELALQEAIKTYSNLPEETRANLIKLAGSEEAVLQEIEKVNFGVVNDPKYAYKKTHQDQVDYAWKANKDAEAEANKNKPFANPFLTNVGSAVPFNNIKVPGSKSLKKALSDITGRSTTKNTSTKVGGSGITYTSYDGYSEVEKTRELNKLKEEYGTYWEPINTSPRSDREKDKEFIRVLNEQQAEDKLKPLNYFPITDPAANKELANAFPGATVLDDEGRALGKGGYSKVFSGDPQFGILTNGDIVVNNNNIVYTIPLNKQDNSANSMRQDVYNFAKLQKELDTFKFKNLKDSEIDEFNSRGVSFKDATGTPLMQYIEIPSIKQTVPVYIQYKIKRNLNGPNIITATYTDPYTGTPYIDKEGDSPEYEVDLNKTAYQINDALAELYKKQKEVINPNSTR
jgi:uncharacterized protein YbaA (DUF1428 family)